MEKVRLLIGEAGRNIHIADHLLYVTYPVIKETKMLYSITEKIANASKKLMQAILYYERMYKRVNPQKGNFRYELEVFRRKCAQRYNLDESYIQMIDETNNVVMSKKESPMTFVRRDKYVICDKSYSKTNALTLKKVQGYLQISKQLINKARQITKC